jgi:DNA-binding NtrC family response regulator
LVVDEDSSIVTFVALSVRRLGYTPLTAANGREAIEAVRGHPGEIDMVLLDVVMPGMDGPATWAALKVIDPGLRCCYMTGGSCPYSLGELLDTGAEDVLFRPFPAASLADVLTRPAPT